MNVYPIAFSGIRYGRSRLTFRKVHWAVDVNSGDTLCGLDIAYVEQAGEVAISIPQRWSASEQCGTCVARKPRAI